MLGVKEHNYSVRDHRSCRDGVLEVRLNPLVVDINTTVARREEILLYHATTRQRWARIQQDGFKMSEAPTDWLGKGVYFWQSAPRRAWAWKRCLQYGKRNRASREDAIVLEYKVEVDPNSWIDLFDMRWSLTLGGIGAMIPSMWLATGVLEDGSPIDGVRIKKLCSLNQRINAPVPRYLDCAAIEHLCRTLEVSQRKPVFAVRSVFQHLERIYPYSAFRVGDHVQVAIRRPELIDVTQITEYTGLAEEENRFLPRFTRKEGCV